MTQNQVNSCSAAPTRNAKIGRSIYVEVHLEPSGVLFDGFYISLSYFLRSSIYFLTFDLARLAC